MGDLCVPYHRRIIVESCNTADFPIEGIRTEKKTMKKVSSFGLVLAGMLALGSIFAIQTFARPALSNVTLTGKITCSLCSGLTQHKGFTPWSWAMYKVSQGDDIVFLTQGKFYRLQGDRKQLSKYIEDTVTVSGDLNAETILVTNVARTPKEK